MDTEGSIEAGPAEGVGGAGRMGWVMDGTIEGAGGFGPEDAAEDGTAGGVCGADCGSSSNADTWGITIDAGTSAVASLASTAGGFFISGAIVDGGRDAGADVGGCLGAGTDDFSGKLLPS